MIVSDSTSLIVLANFKKLIYLENLFKHVFIPKAVHEEINFQKNFTLPSFMQIVHVEKNENLKALKLLLDDGESEAIALSLQKNLPLIIGEKKGRKIAQNLGIKVIGLLGILYLNIKKDFITQNEAKEFLEDAKNDGYRISQTLIDDMLESL